MKNVLDVFKERGFLKQIVFEEELYELLGKESVTFYTGYDPTADSLQQQLLYMSGNEQISSAMIFPGSCLSCEYCTF